MKSSAEKMMQFAEKYNLPLALEIEDEKSQLLQTGWQTLLTNMPGLTIEISSRFRSRFYKIYSQFNKYIVF